MSSLIHCPLCDGKGEVCATPGQPGDGPAPCPCCRYRAALEEIASYVDAPGRPVLALIAKEALRV